MSELTPTAEPAAVSVFRALLAGDRGNRSLAGPLAADLHAPAVVAGISLRLIRMKFGPTVGLRAVAAYARDACGRGTMGLARSDARLVEASVRVLIGEDGIFDGIPLDEQGRVGLAMIRDLAIDLGLSREQIDRLVTEADAQVRRPLEDREAQ